MRVDTISPKDRQLFFHWAAQAFATGSDPDEVADHWQQSFATQPESSWDQLRGVYSEGNLAGGCIVHERDMIVGSVSVPTACIGGVVTATQLRGRGVARTLLEDCTLLAQRKGMGLLFLNGIPDFYHRFGYTDVLQLVYGAIQVQRVRHVPRSPYRLRQAGEADARTVRALYDAQLARYTGSFRQNEEMWRHKIRHRSITEHIFLASDDDGSVRGYLFLNRRYPAYATEVVCTDLAATRALLQAHVRVLDDREEESAEFWWPIPPHSQHLYYLADELPLRCQTTYAPFSDWMARPAALPVLLQALLPLWQERWSACQSGWSGSVKLEIGSFVTYCQVSASQLSLGNDAPPPHRIIRITPQSLVQLIFGFRKPSWYATLPGHIIPEDCLPLLSCLFATDHAYVPGTDHF